MSYRVAYVTAGLLLGARASLGALPYATTLNDLCPGTPDPCVVTGQFAVATNTAFDLGGRTFDLAPGAQLVGDSFASFSFTNASRITLQAGSLVTASSEGTDG